MKTLAGKLAFEARGRRARSLKLNRDLMRESLKNAQWPDWAKAAWRRGWKNQGGTRL